MKTKENNKLIAEFMNVPLFIHSMEYKRLIGHPELMDKEDESRYIINSGQNNWFTTDNIDYDTSWDLLMPVIEKIGEVKMPDEKYKSGERVYVEYIFPRTFGMKNEATDEYMFRFNGFGLWQCESLLEAAYLAVIDVVKFHNETEKNKKQREL